MANSNAFAQFGIEVVDDTASGITSSVSGLKNLKGQLEADEAALRNVQKAMKNLNMGSVVNVQQFKHLKEEAAKLKIQIGANQAKYLQLGGSMRTTGKDSKTLADQLKAGLLQAQGPVGEMSGGFAKLASQLGKAGVVGAAILAAAAIIAVGVAAGVAFANIEKFALGAADARRSELLMLEGLRQIPTWNIFTGRSAMQAADQIQSGIDRVAGSSALMRGDIYDIATSLQRMGIHGTKALQAVADAQSAAGDKGKAYAMQLIQWYRMSGSSAEAAAAVIEGKFGKIARKQALSFGTQMAKLKENVTYLFSGIKIEGFLTGLKSVTDLFSQNTVTGQQLKRLLESIFGPFFGSAEKGFPILKKLIEKAVGWVLDLKYAFIELQIWLYEIGAVKWWKEHEVGAKLISGALLTLKTTLVLIGSAMLTIASSVAVLMAPFTLLGAVSYAAFSAIWEAAKWLINLDWAGIGSAVIHGIADGITSAASFLWNAIKNVASGSLKLFRQVLGIHSPSVVFKTQGRMIGAGAAAGIRASAPEVHAATRSMISIPAANSNSASSSSDNVTSSATNNIGPFVFNISGGNAKDIGDEIESRINKIFHGLELQLGAA